MIIAITLCVIGFLAGKYLPYYLMRSTNKRLSEAETAYVEAERKHTLSKFMLELAYGKVVPTHEDPKIIEWIAMSLPFDIDAAQSFIKYFSELEQYTAAALLRDYINSVKTDNHEQRTTKAR